MLEIEAVGTISFNHIYEKYQGDYAKQHDIPASYQIQLAIMKGGDTHKTLVAEAKRLGVQPSSEALRYTDGDTIENNEHTKGKWLFNLSSKFPISVVDKDGSPLPPEGGTAEEPGDGTLANVAFRIGSNKDKSRLVYFLTGVQLLKVKKSETAPHKFGAFTQLTIEDELEDDDSEF